MSAVDDIQTYLKTFGIEPDHIMALAGRPKAEFINTLLNQNKSVEELVVYEDSMNNLKSIDSMMTRKYSGLTHTVMHYKKIEQKVIDYSLFYVDGNSVTKLETKTDRTRDYKAEKDAAHKAMSKYLADKHNMKLIPRGKLEGIISVMSGRLAVPDLLKSVKEAEKVMSIDTTSWAKHYDTFSNILFDMIR
jgi:hypothetical protein